MGCIPFILSHHTSTVATDIDREPPSSCKLKDLLKYRRRKVLNIGGEGGKVQNIRHAKGATLFAGCKPIEEPHPQPPPISAK